MSVLLLLAIILGVLIAFAVPEIRRAFLHKGSLLLLAFMAVAVLSFASGYFSRYFSAERGDRLDPKLVSAISFIESHRNGDEFQVYDSLTSRFSYGM